MAIPGIGRSFMDTSQRYSQGALEARSAMRPNVTYDAPGKTIGGAIMSGAGMAGAGAGFGAITGATSAGATGALGLGLGAWSGIGAIVGLGAYLLS